MKAFLALASLVALVAAEPPVNYGAPSYSAPAAPGYSAPAAPAYSAPSSYGAPAAPAYGPPSSDYGAPAAGPTVFRHVYVHAAPDEPTFVENKVLRVGGGGDKHVNIIFVKAPSSSSSQQTEVILPEQPQQKTVVYVLVKKPENSNNVKVTGPGPVRPSKPEVFFIRYKNAGGDGGYGAPAAPGPAYGAPIAVAAPAGGYS